MSQISQNTTQRLKTAAAPATAYTGTVADVVRNVRPALPLYLYFPERIAGRAKLFTSLFAGEVAYAVKGNPDKLVLQTLYKNGVRAFDAASIDEVRAVRKAAPKARIYFMHPIKAPEAIAEAYKTHGVRTFVLDGKDELYKILRNTDLAQDMELVVRIALPKNEAASLDFSGKFGAGPEEAAELLRLCRPIATKLGISFHAGHQTPDPQIFARSIRYAKAVIKASGTSVDMLDVGGGFPFPYPGQAVQTLEGFMSVIHDTVKSEGLSNMQLVCEPGRALAADAASVIVRIEGRKGDTLYLNDGTYGSLFDAGSVMGGWRFDVAAISAGTRKSYKGPLQPFRFAGPTCTSDDMMEGPFMLPVDIAIGDWIEVKNLGAYCQVFRSNFNGFGTYQRAVMAGK